MIYLDNVYKFYRIDRYRKVVLNFVTMNFEPGQSYGIMGVNGAGKSTLMRLLAGTELPNSGTIRRTVRVSWPMGFSGGLHPGMTGRENCQFVARVYGQAPRKILEFVADFADIGPYMDAPFGTYSSGMQQRLAFGLSMSINFECYLIDEVMAVGDARFSERCKVEFDKRKEFADIILVSHSISSILEYCDRGLVLANGQLHYFPRVEDAVEMYKRVNQ